MKQATRLLPAKVPITPTEEEAALEYARDFVRACRQEDSGFGFPVLHPAFSHVLVRRLLKQHALADPFGMAKVVRDAMNGDEEADLALRELISEFHARHEPLPDGLVTYNDWLIHPGGLQRPPRHPWKKLPNLMSNIVIVGLVDELCRRFPLEPTRTQTGRKLNPSGCSIASKALHEAGLHRGGEAAVQRVWFEYKGRCL
jgi:hypothetical protein